MHDLLYVFTRASLALMAEFLTTPLLVNNWQKDYKEKKQNNKKGMSFLVKNLNPGSVTYWQFSVWQVTYKSSL